MKLVIAEKPSAARNFAKALGGMEGTYEGVAFRIFALRGHVLELLAPEFQVEESKQLRYRSWSLEGLPWNIEDLAFEKRAIPGCEPVLDELKTHLSQADEVVIATDDDPTGEGELLAWEASPYVHEGANRRPQRPTMKWLNKRLEMHSVGTGATRTSTLAEITAGDERALMREERGNLSLTRCGTVSFALLDGCLIASPEATERLFASMEAVGRFDVDPSEVLASVTDTVVHDVATMHANGTKLNSIAVIDADLVRLGKCPVCGQNVVDKGSTAKTYTCESNSWRKTAGGTWERHKGCGFELWKTAYGRKLGATTVRQLLAKGRTDNPVKGLVGKSGRKFEAVLRLDSSGRITPDFDIEKKKIAPPPTR